MMTLRQILIFVLYVIWGVTPGLASESSKKVALVIGNSDYSSVARLINPVNDATDISAALIRLGFDVTTGIDFGYRQMRLALRDFADQAQDADISLIYYAGHGIEIDKTNYLIPVNAELKSDRDVDFEAIPLDTVLSTISDSRGLKIVLVDACRNNPFLADITRTTATRSIGRGLGRIDSGGVLVGYAAREGTLALDGDGRNSPYAMALLKHLEQPGLEIGKLFRKVRDTVFLATGGRQEPYTYGSLPGKDYFLVPSVELEAQLPDVVPTQPLAGVSITSDYAKAEGRNTLREWDSFLNEYAIFPGNALVGIARNKRSILQDIADARQRKKDRKPWLIPAAGLSGFPIKLTLLERKQVQKSLGFMGFETGGIDGEFGKNTRRSISAARSNFGLTPGTQVDLALLNVLPNVIGISSMMSDSARSFKGEKLPLHMERRLEKALEQLKNYQLVFDYFEGNLYIALLTNGMESWSIAQQTAQKAGGYLVSISSLRENEFVYGLVENDDRFFIKYSDGEILGPALGLFQADGSAEPSGGWTWVSGEPLTYKNWMPGAPNNFEKFQDIASFYRGSWESKSKPASSWQDIGSLISSYIIEID